MHAVIWALNGQLKYIAKIGNKAAQNTNIIF